MKNTIENNCYTCYLLETECLDIKNCKKMIRKKYPLQNHTTFKEVSEVVKSIEDRFSHLHCRIDVHRLNFEIISKNGEISQSEEIIIHDMARIVWDKTKRK